MNFFFWPEWLAEWIFFFKKTLIFAFEAIVHILFIALLFQFLAHFGGAGELLINISNNKKFTSNFAFVAYCLWQYRQLWGCEVTDPTVALKVGLKSWLWWCSGLLPFMACNTALSRAEGGGSLPGWFFKIWLLRLELLLYT